MAVTQGRADLVLVARGPGRARAWDAMLAVVSHKDAELDLVTAPAWSRALGYPVEELSGKALGELLAGGGLTIGEIIGALIAHGDDAPLEVKLRCKDGQRKSFRLYRYYDDYADAVFIVAEELS